MPNTNTAEVTKNNATSTVPAKAAEPTYAELLKRVQELESTAGRQNASVGEGQTITVKVKRGEGAKGAMQIYGLGKFPVSLYPSQAKALCIALGVPKGSMIHKAVTANADALSFRDDREEILAWANGTDSE